ncbi:transcription intermediary factor 1-beta [Halyomorpha halys]|uniref:transcription intermediary factor 1-beta n=1 Tax=Halyomorpha halys TaxID=286706 RepID=UPI0006D5227F|nr:E3 ubiquitin-protein ligase TRIM33-like [Halyomorpha halys]
MFLSDENNDNGNPNDATCLNENEIWPISDCIFCNKKLTSKSEFKRSKLLQCLHAICYNCFINWDDKVDKQCNVCSFYSKKKDVTENKVLAEMVTDEDEMSNEDVCTIHNAPVTHWCNDCAELICEDCVNHHGQLKSTQNHKIKTHKEYLHDKSCAQRSIFPCVVHPQNDLSIVCHTCKIMTCRDCQLEMHKDHKYDFISDSVTNTKTELFDIFKKVEYSSVVLNSALKKISEREEKLETVKKSLVSDIKKEFDLIQELLKKRCENLMLTAIDKANKKLEDCELNRRVITKNLELLQHCLKFVKLVLYSSSDAVLFYTKDLILNHLKRISITQSIPSSADLINLKFSTENIDEAKKQIEICGAVQEIEDLASVDKKYLFAVYSTLMSLYKAKTGDSKQKKNNCSLSDDSQPTSSLATEKTLSFASVVQQCSNSNALNKSSMSEETINVMNPEEIQRQQMVPQLWHIPETMPIRTNVVVSIPEDCSQIGNNIKKVRLQLPSGNSAPSNPKSSDNGSPVSSSDDVEIIDEIMSVLNAMEKREGPLPGLPRLSEQGSPPDFQNESWCSVCLKGGEVVCCNNCPKVFHVGCHIPQIKLPSKDCLFPVKNIGWRCLLCQDVQSLQLNPNVSNREKLHKELKIASRLLLELYCQVEASTPFRFPSTAANRTICLADIKNNLASGKYSDIMSFVKDVRYMFACCFHYERQDYMKIAHSRSLEEMFNRLLAQFVPCNK